jgi:hypothetical protein
VPASPHALADPCRSCRDAGGKPGTGGTWHYPREKTDNRNVLLATDLEAALDRVAEPVGLGRKMLRSEIKAKMVRGARGELHYGRDAEVDKIVSTDHVLEIRVTKLLGDEPVEKLHARIYFNEPARCENTLKFLALECKHDGESGKTEQNLHAKHAEGRLGTCDFVTLPEWV